MMRIVPVLLAGLELAAPMAAAAPDSLQAVRLANQAYQQGRFEEAAAGYEHLLQEGWDNGHLHYNLGNAYYRQGALGPAIRHYLDARLRLPRDEDVAANLALAVRETQDLLDWERPHPASAVLFWLNDFTLREHLKALLWIHLGFWLTMGIHLVRRGGAAALARRIALGLLLVAAVSTGARWHLEKVQHWGVVSAKTLAVLTEEAQPTDTRLHEGAVVRLMREKERWLEIELPDGTRGWARRDQILG